METRLQILEYARLHGLVTDHTQVHPVSSAVSLLHIAGASQISDGNEDLPEVEFPSFSTDEKLSIRKSAAILLASIKPSSHPSKHTSPPLEYERRIKKLKIEVPLLRTDPELDLQSFQVREVPDLHNLNIPLEAVNDEKDEGLQWPSRYHEIHKNMDTKAKTEKLSMPRSILSYMQAIIKNSPVSESLPPLESFIWPKSGPLAPLTPPLMPQSPRVYPYTPSSSQAQLQLTSDPQSMTGADCERIESIIFEGEVLEGQRSNSRENGRLSDTVPGDDDEIGRLFGPFTSDQSPVSLPVLPRTDRSLRVEAPLTPVNPRGWTMKDARSPHDALENIISDFPPLTSDSDFGWELKEDRFFAEAIAPFAEQANVMIEQEQLQRADSTQRVPVPNLDFSLPETTLKAISLEESKEIFSKAQCEYLSKDFWPGTDQATFKLPWSPFPALLGKVKDNDNIEENGFLSDLLEQINVSPKIKCIQERPSVRNWPSIIQRNKPEDEDELELNNFNRKEDTVPSTEKEISHPDMETNSPANPINRSQDEIISINKERIQAQFKNTGILSEQSILQGKFTTADALSNFMFVNGKSLMATSSALVSPHFQKASAAEKKNSVPTIAAQMQPENLDVYLQTKRPFSLHIDPPMTSSTFIISSTLFIQRSLLRQLQALYPSANLMERDLSSFCDGSPDLTLENEVDIIVSPSTGLLWVTLTSIQQKPLPGQKARQSVRDRIAGVALRYERLVVLVSSVRVNDRNHIDEPRWEPLSKYDSLALVDLLAFTQTLADEIQVLYVPGGEAELAQWMVKMMIKYRCEEDFQLLEDSTLWELFLRRAGMNAYAAQVVLAILKASDEDGSDHERLFGLSAFVDMTASRRITMFERVMGGRKVLHRVSEALDEHW